VRRVQFSSLGFTARDAPITDATIGDESTCTATLRSRLVSSFESGKYLSRACPRMLVPK
jgi:hypothetical protein